MIQNLVTLHCCVQCDMSHTIFDEIIQNVLIKAMELTAKVQENSLCFSDKMTIFTAASEILVLTIIGQHIGSVLNFNPKVNYSK